MLVNHNSRGRHHPCTRHAHRGRLTLGGGGALEQIKADGATLITVDVPAPNGAIHIIDTVLVTPPASETIVDIAVATPEPSTLATALKAGALVDTLSAKGMPRVRSLFSPPPTRPSPSCLQQHSLICWILPM